MNNWRYKLYRFMQGRYGLDSFGRFLLIASMILVMLSSFRMLHILYLPGIALLLYTYFRIMSRNIYKRQQENQKYIDLRYRFSRNRNSSSMKMRRKWAGTNATGTTEGSGANDNLQYNFYRCRNCGQTVRVPKGQGPLKITCPNCGNSFIDRT